MIVSTPKGNAIVVGWCPEITNRIYVQFDDKRVESFDPINVSPRYVTTFAEIMEVLGDTCDEMNPLPTSEIERMASTDTEGAR